MPILSSRSFLWDLAIRMLISSRYGSSSISKTLKLFSAGMAEKVGCSTRSRADMLLGAYGGTTTMGACTVPRPLGCVVFGGGGKFWLLSIMGGAGGGIGASIVLSCHRIQSRSRRHSSPSLLCARLDRASQTSRSTPVGMSHTNVSRLTIRAMASATSVPSIFPPSFVIMYS